MTGLIACIGGGGFLVEDGSELQERWLLSLLAPERRARPRVLFVGTAGGDGVVQQLKAYKTFSRLGCDIQSLPFFPYEMKRDYAAEARAADLVYVGGGNTVAMIAVWREFGFDRALRAASDGGTLIAGISAGANCWFEECSTDSMPWRERLSVLSCLGILKGSFCPHYDGEADRRPTLHRFITTGRIKNGYAADDGAALHFIDDTLYTTVSSRPAARGYRIDRKQEGMSEETLATRYLGAIQ